MGVNSQPMFIANGGSPPFETIEATVANRPHSGRWDRAAARWELTHTGLAMGIGSSTRAGTVELPTLKLRRAPIFRAFSSRGGPARPMPVLRAMWGWQGWQSFLLLFIYKYTH